MKHSITQSNNAPERVKLWAVALWLAVWQAGAMLLGEEVLLASPLRVLKRLFGLVQTSDFWNRALFSTGSIMSGLLAGAALGILLGAAAHFSRFVRQLFRPLIAVIRAIPVAGFIILAVVWLNERSLGRFIAFLICLPVFYSNTLQGFASVDKRLLEMAFTFRMSPGAKLRALYLPALLPHLLSAVEVAVGLAWKSGTAAEVIAIPADSIGQKLYMAKIYLETGDMMAWTLTVVLLSALCGRALKALLSLAVRKGGGAQ